HGSDAMRDAAFVFLLVGGDRYGELVKETLLSFATNPNLDFSDSDHWCTGILSDSSFGVSNWLSRLLFSYDYLGEEMFGPAERLLLNHWFADAATFFKKEVDVTLAQLFRNRDSGDYRLTRIAGASCEDI